MIEQLVIEVATLLSTAWARDKNGYRIDFNDGISLSVQINYKNLLLVHMMMGEFYKYLNWGEKAAQSSFNTRNPKFIASRIQNIILPEAREQWRRVILFHHQQVEKFNWRMDIANAIRAAGKSTGNNITDTIDNYDFYRTMTLHQNTGDGWATYQINQTNLDVRATLKPDVAVWLAYVIANPDVLKRMPEIMPISRPDALGQAIDAE